MGAEWMSVFEDLLLRKVRLNCRMDFEIRAAGACDYLRWCCCYGEDIGLMGIIYGVLG